MSSTAVSSLGITPTTGVTANPPKLLRESTCYYTFYLDYRSVPTSILGGLLNSVASSGPESSQNCATLCTCQRIEVLLYDEGGPETPQVFSRLGIEPRLIQGYSRVVERLARIYAGVESLLLGDPFIPRQVDRAFSHVLPSSPLGRVYENSATIANEVRHEMGFFARRGYEDIAYEYLRHNHRLATTLVVMGSGFLGRALLSNGACAHYSKVYGVTDYPKDLRKKVPSSVVCMRRGEIGSLLADDSFHAIAAVSNTTPERLNGLSSLLKLASCEAVVDLSSQRLLPKNSPKHYVHEYDQEFEKLLINANPGLIEIAPTISKGINSRVYSTRVTEAFDAEFQ